MKCCVDSRGSNCDVNTSIHASCEHFLSQYTAKAASSHVQPCPAMSSLLFKYPPVISLCGMGHPLPLAILSGINGVALPGEEQHRSGGCLLLHAPTYSVLSAVLSKRQDDISCSSTRWFRVACRFGITSHGLISRGLDSKKISGTSISK